MTSYIYKDGFAVAVEESEPAKPIPILLESVDVHREPSDTGIRLSIVARVMPWDEQTLAEEMHKLKFGPQTSLMFFQVPL